MLIREATYNDVLAVAKLHAESWRHTYHGILSDDYLRSYVEEDRKELWEKRLSHPSTQEHIFIAEEFSEKGSPEALGFICLVGNAGPVWGVLIDNLHVRHDKKGQGIGKALMRQAAAWTLQNYPGSGIFLHVVRENVGAYRFYQHLGASIHPSAPWNAPDGQVIPEVLCVWEYPETLL